MKNKQGKRKLLIDGIISFILFALLFTVHELTQVNFDLEWFKDIDIWINDFFVNTFVFLLMSSLLSKVKNEYLNFGISYIVSVLIGNFIVLDTSNLTFTPQLIILIALNILALIFLGWHGFRRGYLKERKKTINDLIAKRKEYEQLLLSCDNEYRSKLYNLKKFIRNHPQECDVIDKLGIDYVMQFVKDDKAIRKAAKNDPTNKTTN